MNLTNLTDEQKQTIVDEVNQDTETEADGNVQIISAKEAGLFEDATFKGDIKGQIAKFTAINVHARAKVDTLFDSTKLSNRNIKKAVLAACAIPEEGASITFGGTPQQQEASEALFQYLQVAITTRGIALERAVKYEQHEKELAKKQEEYELKQGDTNGNTTNSDDSGGNNPV